MSFGFFFLGFILMNNIIIVIICILIGFVGIFVIVLVGWFIFVELVLIGFVFMLSFMVNLVNNLFGGIIVVLFIGYLFDVIGFFMFSFLVVGFVLLFGLIFYVFVLGDVKRIKLE